MRLIAEIPLSLWNCSRSAPIRAPILLPERTDVLAAYPTRKEPRDALNATALIVKTVWSNPTFYLGAKAFCGSLITLTNGAAKPANADEIVDLAAKVAEDNARLQEEVERLRELRLRQAESMLSQAKLVRDLVKDLREERAKREANERTAANVSSSKGCKDAEQEGEKRR
ncbi:hypothetical protein EK21DRAFT_111829 [Setomelanomma holmii]|uniref:Uncharacterized protein n=1 Tax=Setomelanomma holmii TaxID=210430 RepID=A0A9P4HCE3_9PLEO|nr:hypothetical protein EK21DRAFT_111829 [Setomelanomma holmii]